MTFRVRVDNNALKKAVELGFISSNKVPKIVASAITDTLFDIRKQAVEKWWPRGVKQRNKKMLTSALKIERGRSATLKGSIFDKRKLQAISRQTEAHTRTPHRGSRKAVPTRAIKRMASGKIRKSQSTDHANVYKDGNLLIKKTGKGKRAKVTVLYTLHRSVSQPATFPFYKLAARTTDRVFTEHVAKRFKAALR